MDLPLLPHSLEVIFLLSFIFSAIDSCASDNGGCSHVCENTESSFICSCPSGYELDGDERTCIGMCECTNPISTICILKVFR